MVEAGRAREDASRALADALGEQRLRIVASDAEHAPESAVITDDRLRLVFTCCHPALPLEGRVALTCKVVAGLSTDAVARAFLVSEATMGQRLLRARRKIAHAGIGYQVPSAEMLPGRLDGVLGVVHLVFTTGWRPRADDAWPRRRSGWGDSWWTCCRSMTSPGPCWR